MLRKIKQARIGLGMEDDTNNPEVVTGAGGPGGSAPTGSTKPAQPVDKTAAAADAAVDGVKEAGESVIEDSEVIAELDDAQAAMEEIYDDMRISLQNGGMNPDMARMAKRYADRTLARVGMSNPIPSCEAFGGFGDRFVATSVSMEGVSDAIKNIWEKIKTWFNNMWKNIRTYWQKVWDAAPKLKARAEALRKKADDLGGKTATEKQIDVGADLVKKLYDENGKLPDGTALETKMAAVSNLTVMLFGDYYAQALKFAEQYGDELAKLNAPTASAIGSIALGSGNLASPASTLKTKAGSLLESNPDAKKKFTDVDEVSTSGALFGGQVLAVATFTNGIGAEDDPTTGGDGKPEQGETKPASTGGSGGQGDPKPGSDNSGVAAKLNGFGKNTVKLITMLEKTPDVSEATMATMALGDVQKLCDEVIKLSDSIASYRKDWEMAEKAQAKIMRAGDNFSRAAGKSTEKGGDDVSAATAAVKLTKTAGEWIAQPNQSFSRYAMESAKAVLMLCDKSLAQYS